MAATGACVFSALRQDGMSSSGSFKSGPIAIPTARRLAVSTTSLDQVTSTSSPETTAASSVTVSDLFGDGRFDMTHERRVATAIVGVGGGSGTRSNSGLEDVENPGEKEDKGRKRKRMRKKKRK